MPSQYWEMELREFVVYSRSRSKSMKAEWKRQRQLNAELQATIANFVPMRDKKAKVFKAQDFMPKERRKLTVEQFDNQLDKMLAVFGGKKGGHT